MTSSNEQLVPVEQIDRDLRGAILSYLVERLGEPCSDGDMPDDRSEELDRIIAHHRLAALRTPPAVEPDEGLVEKPARLKYYPDYIADPDGLERMRQDVLENGGHTMAHINYNSLGRLIDTIENLRFKLATLTPSIRAQALEEAAKVAEATTDDPAESMYEHAYDHAARHIAASIRALKERHGS